MKTTKYNRFKDFFEKNSGYSENVKFISYGVKQPHILLIILLISLAIVPGVIVVTLLTKNYVVGISGNKLIILETSLSLKKVKRKIECDLNQFSEVKTKTGAIFTHLNFKSGDESFKAKFHRAAFPENRNNAMAIAEVLNSKSI